MKRALSALMVVGAASHVAADPKPPVQIAAAPEPAPQKPPVVTPRLLPTGAPACGNVMSKYGARDRLCKGKFFEKLQNLKVKLASLTVQPKPRPDL